MTIDAANRRITAGPYTLELPPNGVAILYEADEGGTEHQLPGGVGYLEALVQFAGEVVRLSAMVDAACETARVEERERFLLMIRAEKADWRGSVGSLQRLEAAIVDPCAGQMTPVCEELRCDDEAAP